MPEIALLDLLVVGIAIGVTYVVGSQVVIPILLGRPLFPSFRSRRQLEKELADTKERLEELRMRQELADLKRAVDKASMPPEVYDIVHGDEGQSTGRRVN